MVGRQKGAGGKGGAYGEKAEGDEGRALAGAGGMGAYPPYPPPVMPAAAGLGGKSNHRGVPKTRQEEVGNDPYGGFGAMGSRHARMASDGKSILLGGELAWLRCGRDSCLVPHRHRTSPLINLRPY